MHLKDYYGILEVEPSASPADIKKAFRRLAQLYHPDKNNNDALSAARFADIKEAYEVLTDPGKKEYYLQQRWYAHSAGKRRKQETITPANVLIQCLELEKYVSRLDVFRMDKKGLEEYICELLNNETISKLHTFGDAATNRSIISAITAAMKPLPLLSAEIISVQLKKLAGNDEAALAGIDSTISRYKLKHRREKYSLLIIIIITLALCLLIWMAGGG